MHASTRLRKHPFIMHTQMLHPVSLHGLWRSIRTQHTCVDKLLLCVACDTPIQSLRCLQCSRNTGCGKSTLLEALQFAAGSPAQQLRVKTLKELCSSSNAEQVGGCVVHSLRG